MNDISIIIPALSSAQQLEAQLSKIFDQLPHSQLELVVVDLSSTDHASQVLAQYATRIFIRHVATKGTDPFGLLKLGADKALNKYLLFLPAYTDYPADFVPVVLQQEPAPGQGIFFSLEKNAVSSSQIRSEQKPVKEIFPQLDISNKTQPAISFTLGTNVASLLCRRDDFRGLKSKNRIKPIDKPLATNTQKTSTTETKKSAKPSNKTDNKDQEYKKAEKTVKSLRYKLFNLGFIERAYQDLEQLTAGKNPHKRRLAARELVLWHANKYTAEDSQRSLEWLSIAKQEERDPVKIRQNAVLEAESLQALGQIKKARTVIERELKKESHADLFLARANLEPEISAKLIWINKALRLQGLSEITCKPEGKATPYDGLQAKPGAIKQTALPADTPKVTVIIPAYNAQDTISVALDSILCQTWTNLEILVVDDCSTDDTVEVVESYVQKDNRVRLIKAEINQGPYVARNLALREATGEFVTVNDADDWSHPEKIELQAQHLLNNREVIGNTSELSRAFSDLCFFQRGLPGYFVQINMSSLMFRRKNIIDTMGFWDSVRFGADGEFKRRIKKCFGDKSVVELKTGPLSFLRQSAYSLTGNIKLGFHNFLMGARKEYVEQLNQFHYSGKSLFIDFPLKKRPFPIPEPMWPIQEVFPSGQRHFDVVIASDFRLPGGTTTSNIEEIKVHKKMGLRTGIVQMSRYEMNTSRAITFKLRENIDGKQVQMLVYGENISCDLLIIRHPPVLQEYQQYIPKIAAKNIAVIVNQSPLSDYSNLNSRIYDLKSCVHNLKRYFGGPGIWYPIGPAVRESLMQESDIDQTIKLSRKDWNNIINVDHWQLKKKNKNNKPIIGRHSRDHYVKWPEAKDELLAAYPANDQFEVHVLGGAEIPKNILGYIPRNWKVYAFNSLHPKDFLEGIDVFVYFTHSDMVEAFGRTPLEAMAAGIPVILPDKFKSLFKNAAIYATPSEVRKIAMELHQNEKYYKKQALKGQRFVQEHFGYAQHQKRLANYIHVS